MIPSHSHVIDVGCDHALLSIYLSNEKDCTCLASDVNEKAISGANLNIQKYKSNVKTIVSNGLDNIPLEKDDYIVLAGMGTATIKKILTGKKLSDHLVIATHNHLEELRRFVVSLGFIITDEKFINDYDKGYVIILFERGKRKYSKLDYQYGPIVREDHTYLLYELEKLINIKKELDNSSFRVRFKNQKEINKLEKLIEKGKD